MGIYINPTGMSKEAWLSMYMKEGSSVPYTWDSVPSDMGLVCLVDNGLFTAAGVAFDENEFKAFNNPEDLRQKIWCIVPRARLLEVCPDLQHIDGYVQSPG